MQRIPFERRRSLQSRYSTMWVRLKQMRGLIQSASHPAELLYKQFELAQKLKYSVMNQISSDTVSVVQLGSSDECVPYVRAHVALWSISGARSFTIQTSLQINTIMAEVCYLFKGRETHTRPGQDFA